MKEFIRMLGELKYMIPVLRYQWPQADENASLAHSFQESTNKFTHAKPCELQPPLPCSREGTTRMLPRVP